MLQKPLLGKTKAAEINWFAYRWKGMGYDGNKGSQHTRSRVLGDSVQRRLPLRCLAISNAQQTAARCSLEGKKRVSEPSVNNLSPANGGGECAGSQRLSPFPHEGTAPVFGELRHDVLMKCTPGAENTCSGCQHTSAYLPRDDVFLFQLVAKGGRSTE